MRVRVTNPNSLFCGEQGEILRSFPDNALGEAAHLVALDGRGFGEHALGLSFADSELRVLPEKAEA